jgi:hypothetical protein
LKSITASLNNKIEQFQTNEQILKQQLETLKNQNKFDIIQYNEINKDNLNFNLTSRSNLSTNHLYNILLINEIPSPLVISSPFVSSCSISPFSLSFHSRLYSAYSIPEYLNFSTPAELVVRNSKFFSHFAKIDTPGFHSIQPNLPYLLDSNPNNTPQKFTTAKIKFLRYMSIHSATALLRSTPADICSRTYVSASCCAGNYGSSMIRIPSVTQYAMLMNYTMVINFNTGRYTDESNYFITPFITLFQLEHLLEIHRCKFNETNTKHIPLLSIFDPPNFSLLYKLKSYYTYNNSICSSSNDPSLLPNMSKYPSISLLPFWKFRCHSPFSEQRLLITLGAS